MSKYGYPIYREGGLRQDMANCHWLGLKRRISVQIFNRNKEGNSQGLGRWSMCGFQGERDKAQLVFYLLRDNIKSYLCGWDWMDMGWDWYLWVGWGEEHLTPWEWKQKTHPAHQKERRQKKGIEKPTSLTGIVLDWYMSSSERQSQGVSKL